MQRVELDDMHGFAGEMLVPLRIGQRSCHNRFAGRFVNDLVCFAVQRAEFCKIADAGGFCAVCTVSDLIDLDKRILPLIIRRGDFHIAEGHGFALFDSRYTDFPEIRKIKSAVGVRIEQFLDRQRVACPVRACDQLALILR